MNYFRVINPFYLGDTELAYGSIFRIGPAVIEPTGETGYRFVGVNGDSLGVYYVDIYGVYRAQLEKIFLAGEFVERVAYTEDEEII